MKIRVMLVDPHNLFREGLKSLLVCEEDIEVVGEAENGQQAIEIAKKLKPDVILMEIFMPVMNGVTALMAMREEDTSAKIIFLSGCADDRCVHRITQWNVSGYLLKTESSRKVKSAIREAKMGNASFSDRIAKLLLDSYREAYLKGKPTIYKEPKLTTRERQILQLIAEGRINNDIARSLAISVKTVEKHRQQIMKKAGVHDTAGLTRHAIATGIIDLPKAPEAILP